MQANGTNPRTSRFDTPIAPANVAAGSGNVASPVSDEMLANCEITCAHIRIEITCRVVNDITQEEPRLEREKQREQFELGEFVKLPGLGNDFGLPDAFSFLKTAIRNQRDKNNDAASQAECRGMAFASSAFKALPTASPVVLEVVVGEPVAFSTALRTQRTNIAVRAVRMSPRGFAVVRTRCAPQAA